MATNHYFNHYGTNTADQRLTENLIIESIKVYGIDVYYMPRETVNMDSIFGEDRLSEFKDARMIEMYVKNVDGFEGEGTLVSNFGLEVRDQVTFTLSQRRFAELNLETGIRATQPATGDDAPAAAGNPSPAATNHRPPYADPRGTRRKCDARDQRAGKRRVGKRPRCRFTR